MKKLSVIALLAAFILSAGASFAYTSYEDYAKQRQAKEQKLLNKINKPLDDAAAKQKAQQKKLEEQKKQRLEAQKKQQEAIKKRQEARKQSAENVKKDIKSIKDSFKY